MGALARLAERAARQLGGPSPARPIRGALGRGSSDEPVAEKPSDAGRTSRPRRVRGPACASALQATLTGPMLRGLAELARPTDRWPGARWRWAWPRPSLRRRLRLPVPVVTALSFQAPVALAARGARARGCATPASTRCRCGPTTPTTTCPTTTPSACCAARGSTTRSRIDRVIGRGRAAHPPPAARARAGPGEVRPHDLALSLGALELVLLPARHGGLHAACATPTTSRARRCLIAGTFDPGLRRLLGAAHRAALVRGRDRADRARQADHGGDRRALLERPLAPALRWAGREPLRRHALAPLRHHR